MSFFIKLIGIPIIFLLLIVSALAGVAFELLQIYPSMAKINNRGKKGVTCQTILISEKTEADLDHAFSQRPTLDPTFSEKERQVMEESVQNLLFDLQPHLSFIPLLRRACVCFKQRYFLNPASVYCVVWASGSKRVTLLKFPISSSINEVSLSDMGLLLEFGSVMI